MKNVKMLAHYHGRLSGDTHLLPGKEYPLPDEAANELIDRELAVPAKLPAREPEQIETVPVMKPRAKK